jgi:threonine synthase
MSSYTGYKCSICRKEYLPASVVYTCPHCGGNLDVILNFEMIRKNTSLKISHHGAIILTGVTCL